MRKTTALVLVIVALLVASVAQATIHGGINPLTVNGSINPLAK